MESCLICGVHEPQCAGCKRYFRDNQTIYCDDEPYDSKATGKHYCLKCKRKTNLKQ